MLTTVVVKNDRGKLKNPLERTLQYMWNNCKWMVHTLDVAFWGILARVVEMGATAFVIIYSVLRNRWPCTVDRKD